MKEEIMELKEKIIQLDKQLDKYRDLAYHLGRRKLFILGGGYFFGGSADSDWDYFRKEHVGESVHFGEENVTIAYSDPWDERDYIVTVNLTYKDLEAAEEESIIKWKLEAEESSRRAKLRTERMREESKRRDEEKERKLLQELKQKYETIR